MQGLFLFLNSVIVTFHNNDAALRNNVRVIRSAEPKKDLIILKSLSFAQLALGIIAGKTRSASSGQARMPGDKILSLPFNRSSRLGGDSQADAFHMLYFIDGSGRK